VHLVEVKYCDDTQPEQQLANPTGQHIRLKCALAQRCYEASLHVILIHVTGNIYKCHSELPLSKLGLETCKVKNLHCTLIHIQFNMQQNAAIAQA